MLLLSRKRRERIRLRLNAPVGPVDVWLEVVEAEFGKVRLGFTAPPEVQIHREEVINKGLCPQCGAGEPLRSGEALACPSCAYTRT